MLDAVQLDVGVEHVVAGDAPAGLLLRAPRSASLTITLRSELHLRRLTTRFRFPQRLGLGS